MVDLSQRELPGRPGGDDDAEPGALPGMPDNPAAEDAPVGLRVGRNPANVGDEVADRGDVTFPDPAPSPAEI